ncbi:hypothetical protein ACFSTI_20910 [Rhizorhabdus histidinilytica]|uniref:Uncharacterized protein n=1 Tax=Rhizorhabdus histidinilytica TaxID=439228 RepID=A0A1T5BMJ6_9SPHN|nr:hypothetical protein [Rhizorhabdus histidinilytica]SKB48438.1 hypothetical protein SAMN06295920_103126 [Rhizorhabdus histidinilytica]
MTTDPTRAAEIVVEQRHIDAAQHIYDKVPLFAMGHVKARPSHDLVQAFARFERDHMQRPTDTARASEGFLAQLRRVNAERYEAWAQEPVMLCEHCGSDQPETLNCAPPFQVQPHSFTRPHPYLTRSNDAGIMFDAIELGGEVGELLNIVKKFEREERGWRGSRAEPAAFADECADVLICLDKLARRRNIDLEAATITKFNATSVKVGLPQKLATPSPVTDEAALSGEDRPDFSFHRVLREMRNGMTAHKWWRKVDGTPAQNDLPVIAANIAIRLLQEQRNG